MIIFCLFCLCRKYPAMALIFITSLVPLTLAAQDQILAFNVIHNGETKGIITCRRHEDGKYRRISIESFVKTRFIFQVKVHTSESCDFSADLLTGSSYSQEVNDCEKLQSSIQWKDGGYILSGSADGATIPPSPVSCTTLSLYYQEPVGITRVYSCNLHQFFPLARVDNGKYKLSISEQKTNYYSYEKGQLVRVDVEQPFYPVQFILKN